MFLLLFVIEILLLWNSMTCPCTCPNSSSKVQILWWANSKPWAWEVAELFSPPVLPYLYHKQELCSTVPAKPPNATIIIRRQGQFSCSMPPEQMPPEPVSCTTPASQGAGPVSKLLRTMRCLDFSSAVISSGLAHPSLPSGPAPCVAHASALLVL